ncbi:TPA: type-F conjugative transfer system protein TraW [Serratia marcescens]|uniref:type-F conjugative transfer system protein TraW n=1 Tax=Serratia TaxID=613 RepID=UPI0011F34533|nr:MULTISPECIES: type-F conjugative transfer system protein TraW [Serratia]MBF4185594.1 type-F conjugative transfer system protein TraW [Serratia ureilytica]MBF8442466.1 type-F conjugative transfer system protein TraW [Serratia ureilytica]MBF8447351.1 type-F conjugative transfer system protein TraW [Serratia ureilytica]BEO88540.1 conjugal transfer pilus assembly protein TraW [Serratia marcescens]
MRRVLAALCLALPSLTQAANLGTVGDIWPIREHDLLSVIRERLGEHFAGKTQERIQQELRDRVTGSVLNPVPIEGVRRAEARVVRAFDPAFVVQKDIADDKGNVFARKGQRVSPFDVLPTFNQTLVFIDGRDAAQLSWFRQRPRPGVMDKLILVGGNIKDSSDALDVRVYFDQGAVLVNKFGIRRVPAIVDQMPGKKLLRITEVAVADDGQEITKGPKS